MVLQPRSLWPSAVPIPHASSSKSRSRAPAGCALTVAGGSRLWAPASAPRAGTAACGPPWWPRLPGRGPALGAASSGLSGR